MRVDLGLVLPRAMTSLEARTIGHQDVEGGSMQAAISSRWAGARPT